MPSKVALLFHTNNKSTDLFYSKSQYFNHDMNRYRHFDEELGFNNGNSAAILPEIDIDEPSAIEINPQLRTYPSNTSRLKLFFLRRTNLERYLFYTVILLLIVLSLFIAISHLYHTKTSIYTLCLTPTCIEISHSYSSGMNQSVDPCEDFYEFVCGRWIRTNIIPKGYSSWSTIRELSAKNSIILKNLLEQTSISSLFYAEQEAIKYYQSCMNITELEHFGNQPLETYFQNQFNFTIEQWIHINQNQTWQKLFIDLNKILSIKYIYSFVLPIKIEADEKNSTWNNIYIDQPQLVLGNRDYYINSTTDTQNNAKNQIIRDTYMKVGSDILQLLGFEKNDSIKRMNHIIQFETELALVSLTMEFLQNHDQTYHLMTIKQLQDQYQPIGFDFVSFFNDLFNSSTIKLNENDQMIVLTYELMSNVSNILNNYLLTPEKSHIVIDHTLLSLVLGMSTHLPLIFEKTILPLKYALFGTESSPERWESCVKQTDTAFGFALGALYVEATFGETDRLKAKELIQNIRDTFDSDLNQLSWIDEPSRIEAKKKLSKIYEKVGYPDFIRDQTKLNKRYGGYPVVDNEFFNNGIKVINRERRQSLLKYRQNVDRAEWRMTPRTVNAYYAISANEIVFPAGILQPPFFHKDLPISINYGAIGSIIGHEMTHGFDNEGREFDSNGNMRLWWTNYSLTNFEDKTKCFVKQYSDFVVNGMRENGQRTLGENIADNGGLKLAYFAYDTHKQQTAKSGNNLRLPGLNYDNNQLFFIAFARTWCNIETSNSMHYDLISDPHSFGRVRVIGSVQNSVEFARAFSCKSNAKMNPSDKCQLW